MKRGGSLTLKPGWCGRLQYNADGRALDAVKKNEVRTVGGREAINWSTAIEDRADKGVMKGKEYLLLSIATCNGVSS